MNASTKSLQSAVAHYFEDRGNFGVEDYLHAYGDPRQALLLYRLFFPQFAAVDGHVVLASRIDVPGEPDGLRRRLRDEDRPPCELLEGYRWTEVPYEFANSSLSDEHDELLACLLARAWKAALMSEFPDRTWETAVLSTSVTGSVVGLCFREAV